MSLVTEQSDFLLDIANLIQYANKEGWQVTVGEGWRTLEQQAIYVKEGKSKTMNSAHLKRLAMDLNFFKSGVYKVEVKDLQQFGNYWKSLNDKNVWGGDWGWDSNHFERKV